VDALHSVRHSGIRFTRFRGTIYPSRFAAALLFIGMACFALQAQQISNPIHFGVVNPYGERAVADVNISSKLEIKYSGADRQGNPVPSVTEQIPWSSIEQFIVAPSSDIHGYAVVMIYIKQGCTYHCVTASGNESDLHDGLSITTPNRASAKSLAILLHKKSGVPFLCPY
jgi:hypothetical protein